MTGLKDVSPAIASRHLPTARVELAHAKPFDHAFGGIRWWMMMLRDAMRAYPSELYEVSHLVSGKPGRRGLMLVDPELIQRAFVRDADAFSVRPDTLVPLLGRGLLTSSGNHWRWQRRVIAPAFRSDRLAAFVPAFARAAERTAARWSALPQGSIIDVGHEMMRNTFDIIAATMLSDGADLDVAQFEQAVSTSLDATRWRVIHGLFRLPKRLRFPAQHRAEAAERWMQDRVLRIVASRRAALAAGARPREDLLDLLLQADDPEGDGGQMADRDVADNILTFIVAGHETTAYALTWTLYALAQHPQITDRLCEEVAEIVGELPIGREHLDRLVYTRQVVQEGLRLFPSAPVMYRKVQRDVTVGDLELRKGEHLVVPIYVVHRHSTSWTDPNRFDPDRFSAAASAGRHRYSFLPFGVGPRTCIGLNFGINEMVVILATLVPRFRLDLASGTRPELTVKLTLRPRRPMRMSLAHRHRSRASA
jgi:cytochrome P450